MDLGDPVLRGEPILIDEASSSPIAISPETIQEQVDALREIESRVLWLSTRMIDAANRRTDNELKVGGHQASCASMVSIMTALWFGHIGPDDKVAVKPHAAPVYHAIKYLTGGLDRSYLTKLRQFGGLQAYPSRTKDPDVSDFSTGSVGLGAVAPFFSAVTRRYLESHFGKLPPARFVTTVGDAELDEGNIWEAIVDPITSGLGNVMMIVDLNRQSLDRVVPGIQATRLKRFFDAAGWHVAEAKYGSKLTRAFATAGGDALEAHIDAMPNEAYQALFNLSGPQMRDKFLEGADAAVRAHAKDLADDELKELVTDLGGHDIGLLLDTYTSCDNAPDRPSVVFAYTVKGWGLPIAGDPLNHAALLSEDQIASLRDQLGLTEETEWDRFDPESQAGRICRAVGRQINNPQRTSRPKPEIPAVIAPPLVKGTASTQDAFGRALTRLAGMGDASSRIVTAAPDVAISTNLGGWINKMGVFNYETSDDHGGSERLLKWAPTPNGQHIELGISEMNLFMLLGQLGLSHEHHGEVLLPVGTVYDPFVLRGLDAFVYGLYNDSRFIVAGTPSGVSLAPEGGAHQSTITASIGIELPSIRYVEPTFATEVEWLLAHGLDQLSDPDGESLYMRLSTRPIDQIPFGSAIERLGEDQLHRAVIAGGYRLMEAPSRGHPGVTILTTGVMVPEALDAAEELIEEGVDATVVYLTSPDLAYRSWRRTYIQGVSSARIVRLPSLLHTLVPPSERDRPIVSVQDASSHTLSWIGSALGVRQIPLGVDRFGESGTVSDLHGATGISSGSIVNAALIAVHEFSVS